MIGTSKSIWGFDPRSIPGCTLWLDGADNASMNSTSAVTVWNDKSGQSNTMTGTGTWSGGTMVFNGTTNAFSNTAYVFPFGAYSMFAVYSNTTAPASTAYMNAVYGSNGYPMLGVYDANKYVTARSVVANTGALVANVAASSNVLVSATYTPSTFSPFVNGTAATTLAGTTLTTTGIYVGGPSNYFNGSISEVLIFGTTLTAAQRQSVEGYLSRKWGIGSRLLSTHPFYTIPPFNRYFNPTDIPGCSLWLDASQDQSSNGAYVSVLQDYSGSSANFTPSVVNSIVLLKNSLNGLPVYNFGATTASNSSFNWGTDFTQIVVVKTAAGNWRTCTRQNSNTYNNYVFSGNVGLMGIGNTSTFNDSSITGSTIFAASTTGTTGWQIFCIGYASAATVGTNYTLNGSNRSTTTGTAYSAVASNYPMYLNGNGGLNGQSDTSYVAEVIHFNYSLTSVQRQQLEGYLANKWGLTSSFPITHPYYKIPSSTPVPNPSAAYGPVMLANLSTTGGIISWNASSTFSEGFMWYVGTSQGGNCVANGYIANSTTYMVFFTANLIQGTTYYAWVTPYNAIGPGASIYSSGVLLTVSLLSLGTKCQYLVAYTPSNTANWGVSLLCDTPYYATGTFVNVDSSSNVYVCGTYGGFRGGSWGAGAGLSIYNSTQAFVSRFPDNPNNLFYSYISQFSSNGILNWAARTTLSTNSSPNDSVRGIATDSSGNVYVAYSCQLMTIYDSAGASNSNSFAAVAYKYQTGTIIKYTSTGLVSWVASMYGKVLTPGTVTSLVGIVGDSTGNTYVTGRFSNSPLTFYNSDRSAATPTIVSVAAGYDCFVAKYSATGFFVWGAQIASTGVDGANGIAQDANNNIYVLGYCSNSFKAYNAGLSTGQSISAGGSYIAKYSNSGTVTWVTRALPIQSLIGIAADSTGNVYVVGNNVTSYYNIDGTTVTTVTGGGICIAKYTSAGAVEWVANTPVTTVSSSNIAVDPSGNIYIVGSYTSTTPVTLNSSGQVASTFVLPISSGWGKNSSAFMVKYTSVGVVAGVEVIRGKNPSDLSTADGIIVTGTGAYIAGSYIAKSPTTLTNGSYTYPEAVISTTVTIPVSNVPYSASVFVYDSNGVPVWAAPISCLTNAIYVNPYAIRTDSSSNIVVYGSVDSNINIYNAGGTVVGSNLATTSYSFYLAKYNSAGTILWATSVKATSNNTPSTDVTNAMIIDALGNITIGGNYYQNITFCNVGGSNALTLSSGVSATTSSSYIVKYSQSGSVLWGSAIRSTATTSNYTTLTSISGDVYGNVYGCGLFSGTPLRISNGNGQLGASVLGTAGITTAFLVKYSSEGIVQWTSSASNVYIYGCRADTSGNVYITGTLQSTTVTIGGTSWTTPTSSSLVFVGKYTGNGVLVWLTSIAFSNTTVGISFNMPITTDLSGNVYIVARCAPASMSAYNAASTLGTNGAVGISYSVGPYSSGFAADTFIVKYSPTGVALLLIPLFSSLGTIVVSPSGNIYALAGAVATQSYALPIGGGSSSSNIVKFSPAGAPLFAISSVYAVGFDIDSSERIYGHGTYATTFSNAT